MNRNFFFATVFLLLAATAGWFYFTVSVAGEHINELETELAGINARFNELAMV